MGVDFGLGWMEGDGGGEGELEARMLPNRFLIEAPPSKLLIHIYWAGTAGAIRETLEAQTVYMQQHGGMCRACVQGMCLIRCVPDAAGSVSTTRVPPGGMCNKTVVCAGCVSKVCAPTLGYVPWAMSLVYIGMPGTPARGHIPGAYPTHTSQIPLSAEFLFKTLGAEFMAKKRLREFLLGRFLTQF